MKDPCPDQCLDHGICNTHLGHCQCMFGWFGDSCDQSAAELLGSSWEIRNAILATLFGLVAFVTLVQMLLAMRTKPLSKMTCFLMLIVLAACVDRLLFIAIDPWGLKGIFPPVLASLLYEFAIGCMATAYSLLIAFWASLYKAIEPNYKWRALPFKKTLIVNNTLIWVLLFPCAILFRTLPTRDAHWLIVVYSIYLSAFCLVMAVGFLTYGLSLYFSFNKNARVAHRTTYERINKITALSVLSGCVTILTVISVVLGAPFAMNYNSGPEAFLFWQTLYRCFELVFCLLIIVFFGNWSSPELLKALCTRCTNSRTSEEYDERKPLNSISSGSNSSQKSPSLRELSWYTCCFWREYCFHSSHRAVLILSTTNWHESCRVWQKFVERVAFCSIVLGML